MSNIKYKPVINPLQASVDIFQTYNKDFVDISNEFAKNLEELKGQTNASTINSKVSEAEAKISEASKPKVCLMFKLNWHVSFFPLPSDLNIVSMCVSFYS